MSTSPRAPGTLIPQTVPAVVSGEGRGSKSDVRLFDPPPDVRFRTWPVIDEGGTGWLLVAGQLGLAMLAGWIAGQWLAGAAVLALFLLAGRRFWLPTEYDVGSAGIVVGGRNRRRLRWNEVRAYNVEPQGVMVWTVEWPVAIDAFSGVYLPSGELTDAVHAVLEFYARPLATGDEGDE